MEVAVKGKSPSYLHLFPHSSAGDRGGFSKPGGKLSITLVSPFETLNFFRNQASSINVCLWYGKEEFSNSNMKILPFFPPSMPETIFSGVLV